MDYEVKNTFNIDKGLIALRHFLPKHPILKLDGKLITEADIDLLPLNEQADKLQIGQGLYLDMTDKNEFFINHSCNPNTFIKIVGEHAYLMCLLPIKPNDEITFDYSITATDKINEWSMKCLCKQWNCRKIISGYSSLTKEDEERYLELGIVPKYNL